MSKTAQTGDKKCPFSGGFAAVFLLGFFFCAISKVIFSVIKASFAEGKQTDYHVAKILDSIKIACFRDEHQNTEAYVEYCCGKESIAAVREQ